MQDILDLDDAKEAWEELERQCSQNTEYGAMSKLRELASMTKGELSVQDYVSKMVALNRMLKLNDLHFKDRQLAFLILSGLPREFEITVKTLVAQTEKMTVGIIKQVLLEHESEMKTKEEYQGTALKTTRNAPSKQQQPAQKSEKTKTFQKRYSGKFYCYACGGDGHIARNCEKAEKDKQQNGKAEETKGPDVKKATVVTREHIALFAQKNTLGENGVWIVDGGASDHMSSNKDLFTSMRESSGEVQIGDGSPLLITGVGSVRIKVSDDCGGKDITLSDVLYVPNLQDNLISQGQLEEKGVEFRSKDGVNKALLGEKLLFQAHRIGRLYFLTTTDGASVDTLKNAFDKNVKKASRVSQTVWHNRLGHPSQQVVGKMHIMSELAFKNEEEDFCEPCVLGKMTRKKFPVTTVKEDLDVLGRVHSDIMGPIRPVSLGRKRFVVTFVDEGSRYVSAVAMKEKGEALQHFKDYKNKVEVLHQKKIREFQTDRGAEYLSKEFQEYLAEHGIHHRKSVEYTPQQNGLAERINLTLCNTIRCLLFQSGVPLHFWAEAQWQF